MDYASSFRNAVLIVVFEKLIINCRSAGLDILKVTEMNPAVTYRNIPVTSSNTAGGRCKYADCILIAGLQLKISPYNSRKYAAGG